jgi:spore coat polysaccharide biosynthesis protein SpsF (cytidylyltransferase family)
MIEATAFIQARCSSSRFPHKVVAPLGGTTLIEFMVARVRRARRIGQVVVITSTEASDDPLVEVLERAGIPYHRGSLQDVLGRFVSASQQYPAAAYVRLTGDCPLVDPQLIDALMAGLEESAAQYASNVDPPTFPDGLDIECFLADTLAQTHRMAQRGPEREHVTLWMRSDAAGLRRWNLRAPCDMSAIRLTVDYPDDLRVVRHVVDRLASPVEADLYDCLRELGAMPELLTTNSHPRNEGLDISLRQESATRSPL